MDEELKCVLVHKENKDNNHNNDNHNENKYNNNNNHNENNHNDNNNENNNNNDMENQSKESRQNDRCASFCVFRDRVSHIMQHNRRFHLFITALVVLDVAIIILQLILEASRKKNGQCSRWSDFWEVLEQRKNKMI